MPCVRVAAVQRERGEGERKQTGAKGFRQEEKEGRAAEKESAPKEACSSASDSSQKTRSVCRLSDLVTVDTRPR